MDPIVENQKEETVSTVPITDSLQAALSPPQIVPSPAAEMATTLRTDTAVQRTQTRSIESYYEREQLLGVFTITKTNALGDIIFSEEVTPALAKKQANIGWQNSVSNLGPRYFTFDSVEYRLRLTSSTTQQGAIHVTSLPITRRYWKVIQKSMGIPVPEQDLVANWQTLTQLPNKTFQLDRLDVIVSIPNTCPLSYFQVDTNDYPLGEILISIADQLDCVEGSAPSAVLEVYRSITGMKFHGMAFDPTKLI